MDEPVGERRPGMIYGLANLVENAVDFARAEVQIAAAWTAREVVITIADDGALSSMNEKGTKTAMGKSEGVGTAKRAALLSVAFALWGTKAPAPPKATAKPGGKKPAGKK